MSIVIRLQNLPLSAKSGDIRRFFGGLRIPNGGVHIVGGEKGDAFIAFTSDEDARLAMKKDGQKIKDARVMLCLSSCMEMNQEIAKITKKIPDNLLRKLSPDGSRNSQRFGERRLDRVFSKDYTPPRGRMVTRMAPSHRWSRSPRRSRSPKRSRSPRRLRSPRRFKSPRRSRSPRTMSRSPRRQSRFADHRDSESPSSRMSLSPISGRSVSPPLSNHTSSMHAFHSSEHLRGASQYTDEFSKDKYFDVSRSFSGGVNMGNKEQYVSEEQAELERKITEALERGYAADIQENSNGPYQNFPPFHDPVLNLQNMPNRTEQHYSSHGPNSFPYAPEYSNQAPTFSDGNGMANNSLPGFPSFGNNFQPGFGNQAVFPTAIQNPVMFPSSNPLPLPEEAMPLPPLPIPLSHHAPPSMPAMTLPPPPPSNLQMDVGNLDNQLIHPGFYVTMSGLDPNWNFNDVQLMLRGIFIPLGNIKWEVDDRGLKTGTAFVKLSNEDDFNQLLSNTTYTYNNKLITVAECPNHVYQKYFLPDWPPKPNLDGNQSLNMYYKMKGLPYYATYDSVLEFFKGLDVADLYIEFSKLGKASGLCWVSFKTMHDYHEALNLDGKQLGHRIVHFKPSTKSEMMKKKRRNGDLFYQSAILTPAKGSNSKISATVLSKPKRPLCAMLTGLPSDVTPGRVMGFFKDSGLVPDATHVTLNDLGRPFGQAFVEFSGFRDFDAALQCHGNTMEKNIICVKQVLYEEMSKILSSKRAMHYYGTSHTSAPANLPDKVPYLWQPPDGNQDGNVLEPEEIMPQDNYRDMPNTRDYNPERMNVQVFDYGNQSNRPPTVLTKPPDFLKNDPYALPIMNERSDIKFSYDSFQEDEKFRSFQKAPTAPIQTQKSTKLGQDIPVLSERDQPNPRKSANFRRQLLLNTPRDSTLIKIQNDDRVPVKFDVKIKQQVAKHTKVDDAFDKNCKLDPKKKLSRLSPEKIPEVQPKPNPIKNKDDSKSKSFEKTEPKHPSPRPRNKPALKEEKNKPQNRTKVQNTDRKDPKPVIKSEKDVKSRDFEKAAEPKRVLPETKVRKGFPSGYREKQIRKPLNKHQDRVYNRRDDSYRRNFSAQRRRSYSRSPNRYDDFEPRDPYSSYEGDYSSYNPAVVQICNVHPSIGSHEIKKFLCGYEIDSEQIIRGYTDTGEPTGDVRVTFKRFNEAKMAVRNLDNHLLEGIPVTMFLVT